MDLVGGGVDSRGSCVSKILYVKTKELGPLGGRASGAPPLDPPMLQPSNRSLCSLLSSMYMKMSNNFKLCFVMKDLIT